MPRSNLLSLFLNFKAYPNGVAFIEQRGYRRAIRTYAELAQRAETVARELQRRGVRTGDRVLLWGPNSFEWVAAFWGCLLRGAAAVPLDDSSTFEFASRVIGDAAVQYALVSRAKSNAPFTVRVGVLEEFPDNPNAPKEAEDRRSADDFADEPITRNHIAEILFTSGTTSEPRGVVLTHGNFLANLEPLERGIDDYRKYERWFHPLRFVSLVPLSHVFGQFMSLFVPPLLGATVVFEHTQQPAEILRTVKRERATALIAVPRMLDALRAALEQEIDKRGWRPWFGRSVAACSGEKFLRRAWRFRRIHRLLGWKFWALISGGAALSGQSEEFFKRIGYAVVQGYGMTETASLISLNHPFSATEGSVGRILPGREFQLAADGEILVRGENVSSGYWEKGALREARAENDGWLRTGDLGELDAAGNLRFKGRKKNVIVTPAGLNIYPEDLEAALRKQSGIRDAIVVPLESDGNAEALAVLLLAPSQGVASSDSATPAAQTAIAAANSTLAEFQQIRRWVLWPDPDFPRTPTGKPRLAVIARGANELLRAAPSRPASGPGRSGGPAASAREDLSSSAMLPDSAALASMSSLDRVELLSNLERRYQVELNETQFAEARTTRDLQKLLEQPAARRTDYPYPRWPQYGPVRLLRLILYYALTWPATLLLAHPRILGRRNLAGLEGPVVLVSNHITRRADIGLILFSLPRRYRHTLATAMGGETLRTMRHPPAEWFLPKRLLYQLNYFLVVSLFNVFPLPQLSGFRQSFRFAGESVDRGYSILVFPEGIVNDRDNAGMIRFEQGIGLLTENLQIPVIPLRLDGVWQMKQERRRLAHQNEITVRIGLPVTFAAGTPPAEIAARLEALVRGL